ERFLGEANRLGERVRRERASRGLLEMVCGHDGLTAELEVARDDRVVLAHLREPAPGARVEIAEHVVAERCICDLARERVLERPLARLLEARRRLLDEHLRGR